MPRSRAAGRNGRDAGDAASGTDPLRELASEPSGSRLPGTEARAERKRDAGEAESGTASLRELASEPCGSRAARHGSAG
ncbi:hypothetical protein ERY13_33890 [Paenibacillus mucilaginosus]|nr:hypothetical protein ERY13_33890 [Paenibacillus mucilaginosus]